MKKVVARSLILLACAGAALGCKKPAAGANADGGAMKADDPAGASLGAFLDSFEGQIDLTAKGKSMSSSGGPMNLSLLVKSGKLRFQPPAGMKGAESMEKGYFLVNTPEKKLYVVDDSKKQAMLIDLNHVGDHMKTVGGPHKPAAAAEPPPKLTKTGKKDKIAGYSCEEWEIAKNDGTKGDVCVAQEGASWFHLPSTGLPTEHAWAAELMDGKHFPLRFVGFEKDGSESARVEVTKIDKRTMNAADFEVPPGYKVMDLAQMMEGLGGPGGPGMPPGMPSMQPPKRTH